MSPGTPPVREMAAAELDAVVALHRDAFPQAAIVVPGHGSPGTLEYLDFTVELVEGLEQ